MRNQSSSRGVWLAVVVCVLLVAPAWAGDLNDTITGRALQMYGERVAQPGSLPAVAGTLATFAKAIPGSAFVPLEVMPEGQTPFYWTFALETSGYYKYATAGLGVFDATLDLPSGALITGAELDACDTSAAGQVVFSAYSNPKAVASVWTTVVTATTGTTETPGCSTFSATASPSVTVDNGNNAYGVEVFTSALDTTTRFKAMRVLYKLQISPAPAVASFIDVPTTHWAFQYIEALKSSGITTGCNPPLLDEFCPNGYATRAEMAAFLARALGLHWAP